MTNTAHAPARRRRHAHLIATATQLVGECAQAAAAVYEAIAQAPPHQQDVPVSLWPAHLLAQTASGRLEAARSQDDARWPHARSYEDQERQSAFERRCTVIEAETVVLDAALGLDHASDDSLLPPMMATMSLTDTGLELLAALDDPERALELLEQIREDGHYTPDEVLDDALATVLAGACLTLRNATEERDPSGAAERCLAAARTLAQAVTLASIDTDTD